MTLYIILLIILLIVLGVLFYSRRNIKNLTKPEFKPGTGFDNFTIQKNLKSGEVTGIYKAVQKDTNSTIVLKIMNSSYLHDDKLVNNFLLEGKILEYLQNKYSDSNYPIVRVYKYGKLNSSGRSRPFIVLEYLEGTSLEKALRFGKLSVAESVSLIRKIAGALSLAHNEGIWHKDLSPENIMLIGKPHDIKSIKIIDFGIAKYEYLRDHQPDNPLHGMPSFMSPEQCKDEKIDGRSDIYSLGMIFYTLIAGRPPFANKNQLEVMRMQLNTDVPALSKSVPYEVTRIIFKMIEKNKDLRYKTIDELISELKKLPYSFGASAVVSADGKKLTAQSPSEKITHLSAEESHPQKPADSLEIPSPIKMAAKSDNQNLKTKNFKENNLVKKLVLSLGVLVIVLILFLLFFTNNKKTGKSYINKMPENNSAKKITVVKPAPVRKNTAAEHLPVEKKFTKSSTVNKTVVEKPLAVNKTEIKKNRPEKIKDKIKKNNLTEFGKVVREKPLVKREERIKLPAAGIAPSFINFGSSKIADRKKLQVVVKNSGDGILRIESAKITGQNSGDFALSYTSNEIKPGLNETFEIRLNANKAGSKKATLVVVTNDRGNKTISIPITAAVTAEMPAAAIDNIFENANTFYNDKNYLAAELRYSEVLQKIREQPKAYYMRGLCRNKLKDYKNAVSDFYNVIAFQQYIPQNERKKILTDSYYNIAMIFTRQYQKTHNQRDKQEAIRNWDDLTDYCDCYHDIASNWLKYLNKN